MSIVIVVPHKDCPEKAHRLLKSIPSDIKVVVVDDNSQSGNYKKLTTIISNDFQNAILINNVSTESNAGTARNTGIDYCSSDSEWIMFADSDDEFRTEEFNQLQDFLSEEPVADVVFFDCLAKREVDGSKSDRCATYKSLISNWPKTRDIIAACWPVPWGKAIRSKIILDPSGPRFESRCAGNDMEFSAKLAALKPKVSVFPNEVYICYESDSSLTSILTPEKALDRLKANIKCNDLFISNEVGKPHLNYCLRFFLVSLPLIIRKREFPVLMMFSRNFFKAFISNMRAR